MISINATVTDQAVRVENYPLLVTDSQGVYEARFEFSHLWDDLGKTAVFEVDGISYSSLIIDGVCTIPSAVFARPAGTEIADKLLRIGVYGIREEGAPAVVPTVWSKPIKVESSAMVAAFLPPDPELTVYQQIIAALESKASAADLSDHANDGDVHVTEEDKSQWDEKLSDAPSDGKQYARKDGEWAEVEGGSGGTADHRDLTNRDAADQHPMSAITGLNDALASKAAADDIPTKLSDLTGDSTHRTVSDTEKSAWNAKQDDIAGSTSVSDLDFAFVSYNGDIHKVSKAKLIELIGGQGGGMENPMTTAGDLIVGGASGTPERLAKGADGKVLKVVDGALVWDDEQDISGLQTQGITDAGGYFTTDTVEGALQEIGAEMPHPTAKTDAMTQPVGMDSSGALFTVPGGGESGWEQLVNFVSTEEAEEYAIPITNYSKIYTAKEIYAIIDMVPTEDTAVTARGNLTFKCGTNKSTNCYQFLTSGANVLPKSGGAKLARVFWLKTFGLGALPYSDVDTFPVIQHQIGSTSDKRTLGLYHEFVGGEVKVLQYALNLYAISTTKFGVGTTVKLWVKE